MLFVRAPSLVALCWRQAPFEQTANQLWHSLHKHPVESTEAPPLFTGAGKSPIPLPGTPNSPMQALFTYFGHQGRYYLFTWSPGVWLEAGSPKESSPKRRRPTRWGSKPWFRRAVNWATMGGAKPPLPGMRDHQKAHTVLVSMISNMSYGPTTVV